MTQHSEPRWVRTIALALVTLCLGGFLIVPGFQALFTGHFHGKAELYKGAPTIDASGWSARSIGVKYVCIGALLLAAIFYFVKLVTADEE